jgi:hypothetical protein
MELIVLIQRKFKFNHSNSLLQKGSEAQKTVKEQGYNFAYEGMVIDL